MAYDLETLEFESVLKILSGYAKTKMAKDAIFEIKPISNIEIIEKKLNEVNEAYNAIIKYDDIPLGGVNSIKDSILRCKLGSVLSIEELLNVSQLCTSVSNLLTYKNYLDSNKIKIELLSNYFNSLVPLERLKATIDTTIDSNGYIYDNASSDLFIIRRQISSLQNRLRSKLNEIMQSKSSMLSDNIVVSRANRLCLPFKVEYKNSIKGVVLDESSSGTTVYIEPMECSMIQNQIDSNIQKEKKEIQNILKSLSLLVNSESDNLINNLSNIEALDIIYAKAMYAKEYDHIMPKVNNEGITNIIKGRHPLIDRNKVVPTDIEFGSKYNTVIITGPNTGGKTVVLKTVGIITLMMMSGMFVPCKEGTNLSIYDDVFVDIGDTQSIEQSLSTFSGHMTKICKIVNNVSDNSLVLLDELGSGTDPKEGSSLAIAILKFLHDRKARVITTTHYSDLKAYAYMSKDICNASVEFNSETLKPTYKLLMGVPGKSNALQIVKRLGLDERIIEEAIKLNDNRYTDSEVLMDKLDIENTKISNIKDNYMHMISEYNQKLAEIDSLKLSIEKERKNIIDNAIKEANEIIKEAKEDSINLLNEIDKIRNDINVKEHEVADIKFVARNLKTKHVENQVFDYDLRVGDYVHVINYDKEGKIITIKKDKYEVQVGQFKMTFKKDELRLSKPPVDKPKVRKVVHQTSTTPAKMQLDLRGYRYEDVKEAVVSFIDKALLANFENVYIIHGFGTGAVREAVWKTLKSTPHIKSYRFGKEGEGLNGVTVVYLR